VSWHENIIVSLLAMDVPLLGHCYGIF